MPEELFRKQTPKISLDTNSSLLLEGLPISPVQEHNREGMGFPSGSDGKESASNAADPGSIPGSGRSPGGGNGNPLQYSCLENSMDRGAWWAHVRTCTHTHTHTHSQDGWGFWDSGIQEGCLAQDTARVTVICKSKWQFPSPLVRMATEMGRAVDTRVYVHSKPRQLSSPQHCELWPCLSLHDCVCSRDLHPLSVGTAPVVSSCSAQMAWGGSGSSWETDIGVFTNESVLMVWGCFHWSGHWGHKLMHSCVFLFHHQFCSVIFNIHDPSEGLHRKQSSE